MGVGFLAALEAFLGGEGCLRRRDGGTEAAASLAAHLWKSLSLANTNSRALPIDFICAGMNVMCVLVQGVREWFVNLKRRCELFDVDDFE